MSKNNNAVESLEQEKKNHREVLSSIFFWLAPIFLIAIMGYYKQMLLLWVLLWIWILIILILTYFMKKYRKDELWPIIIISMALVLSIGEKIYPIDSSNIQIYWFWFIAYFLLWCFSFLRHECLKK